MPKNLDGIKKLSPEELKKYREIVLDYIGEKAEVKKPLPAEEKKPLAKKVDAIKLGRKIDKIMPAAVQQEKPIEPTVEEKVNEPQVGQEELERTKALAEEDRLKRAIKKQAEDRKRLSEEEKQFKKRKDEEEKLQKLKKIEEERKKKESMIQKIKQEENRRWQIMEEKRRREEERLEQEKEKAWREERLKEEAEIREREIMAKQEKEKRRRQRARKIKKLQKDLKKRLAVMVDFVIEKRKTFLYTAISVLSIIIVGYLVFGLLLIGFNIDNGFTRKVEAYLPVPALITNLGTVDFYAYKDMVGKLTLYNMTLVSSSVKQTAERNLLIKMIYDDLAKKYRLTSGPNDREKELADKIMLDRQINQTAIFRIEKIYSLLAPNNDLDKVKDYADEYDTINPDWVTATVNYGSSINNLTVGQISSIIPTNQGYYLIKINSVNGDSLNLTYLFVKAIALDDYVNQQLAKIKVFSLVN